MLSPKACGPPQRQGTPLLQTEPPLCLLSEVISTSVLNQVRLPFTSSQELFFCWPFQTDLFEPCPVEADQSPSLEGWTDCDTFTAATKQLYSSDLFTQKEQEVSDFLKSLVPIVNGRNVTLPNFYNVFDYINVCLGFFTLTLRYL